MVDSALSCKFELPFISVATPPLSLKKSKGIEREAKKERVFCCALDFSCGEIRFEKFQLTP